MNYSEIQIEELRQMIMDNSIDPSMLSVDDCAEILYYEVENTEPCDKIIDFCNNIIKSSSECQNIKQKDFNKVYKELYKNNDNNRHKKSIRYILTIAATIIILPVIFFTSGYAFKYIYGLITNWEEEKITIYEQNYVITNTESKEPKDDIKDAYIDDVSLLPDQIKRILPNSIYSKYSFQYCSIYEQDTVTEFNFGFCEGSNILISFYEFDNNTDFYALELPKKEDSKYEYTSHYNKKFYICENEDELVAVSVNNNIIVSIYGDISIDDMNELIDMIEIPETLP